jgi:ATP-dependent Clp protease ATP-binding subunit ClpC
MYERFTDRARRVMEEANQEAKRLNHEFVGTEHLLLGMLREGSGVAASVLRIVGLDLRKTRREVKKFVLPGRAIVTSGKLPLSPRAKRVIDSALEEARKFDHDYIGTEHLLLGLVRDPESVASRVLINLAIKSEDVRKEVLNMILPRSDNCSLMP